MSEDVVTCNKNGVNVDLFYAFFWVILRRLKFICRRFGTLCLFHLHRQVVVKNELGLKNVGVFLRERLGSKIA
jgi:hypothetical protein